MAYLAAVMAHPGYTRRFQDDLVQPGLRLPLTRDAALFAEAVVLGEEVIWLHTFGERYADPSDGWLAGPPRMPTGDGPLIPRDGAIPSNPDRMPDRIDYDADKRRLRVGEGFIDNVPPEVWQYEVSGKQVLAHWFSYRKKDRTRPVIGDRRPPSPLEKIQPDRWLADYTTELLNVLHVSGRLVALEPRQADLLTRICTGPLISADTLRDAGAGFAVVKGLSALETVPLISEAQKQPWNRSLCKGRLVPAGSVCGGMATITSTSWGTDT